MSSATIIRGDTKGLTILVTMPWEAGHVSCSKRNSSKTQWIKQLSSSKYSSDAQGRDRMTKQHLPAFYLSESYTVPARAHYALYIFFKGCVLCNAELSCLEGGARNGELSGVNLLKTF